jgi:lipoprotein-releasing system ATP-binding protein
MSNAVAATETPNVNGQVLVEARGVSKTYHDGTRELEVLRGADLTVRKGEIISIVGASGAGKSTLLHLLGALDKPNAGTIKLDGKDLGTMDSKSLAALRARSIGFIFQFHHLLSEFNALENCMIPGLIRGEDADKLHTEALASLKALGLEERATHRPVKLSGGEQQRVALARALVNDPDLVLADEPTGNLDGATARTVIDLLWNNVRNNNKSLVIVTHDPEIAKLADTCLRLTDKKLVQE